MKDSRVRCATCDHPLGAHAHFLDARTGDYTLCIDCPTYEAAHPFEPEQAEGVAG